MRILRVLAKVWLGLVALGILGVFAWFLVELGWLVYEGNPLARIVAGFVGFLSLTVASLCVAFPNEEG